MHKDIIIWDWNGTMLNDVAICVESINQMLSKRQMTLINTKSYKALFNFPVRDYYKTLGFDFDKESLEELSNEFIFTYNSKIHNARLQTAVLDVLYYFQAIGKKQVVISAMEQKMLEKMLTEHRIRHYFDGVAGLSDYYANGKVELAQDYVIREKIDTKKAVFIGDTLHDAHVADKIGTELILVSNGHHSAERLSINGYTIIDNLEVLLENDFFQS